MTTLFLVFRGPGPAWVPGKPTRQQPLWDEHAAFMDHLFEQGRVVLGGPYADYSLNLVVVEGRDVKEVTDLFRDDPWAGGVLDLPEVTEWTIFLDSRAQPGSQR
jgi:uncharacterized protein